MLQDLHRWTQTDQVRCFDQTGRPVGCADSGQDGAQPKSNGPWKQSRFCTDGGLVHDNLTGAAWSRDANPAEFPLTWDEAQAYVAEMARQRVHGRDDWQLPNRQLLFSLVSHETINPVLPPNHPFENVFTGYYWSDDTCARLKDQAWYVHMGGGRVHRGMKHGSYMVWPVSAGNLGNQPEASLSAARLSVTPTGIYDSATGLTWRRDAGIAQTAITWPEALATIDRLNRDGDSGATDWRLPGIRELASLVDLETHSPALPAGHPFVHLADAYWSSTTSVYEPRYAWTLYLRDGIVGVGYKPDPSFFVWPVRGPSST